MRKAPEKKKTKESTITSKSTANQKDHFTFRIPKLKLKDSSLNAYLVFALVIFAFLLGMLTNKVLYLQDQVKNGSVAETTNNTQDALPTQPAPPEVVKVDSGHLPLLGDKDAKVTIVEFSDFQCPFCKRYFDETHQQIDEKYVKTGKVKFAYRHFPLNSIHPNAQKAAEASECANEQDDAFWKYHDILFENMDTWSPLTSNDVINTFVDYAGQVGLNTDQFKTCLESDKFKEVVAKDIDTGNGVQVDGTPAFFVNGRRMVGAQPFSEFEKVIEAELKK